jgi:hypothetical protein
MGTVMPETIDLGDGHSLRWLRWAPDDLPGNRELYGVPLPVVERAGAVVVHGPPDEPCEGVVHFAGTRLQEFSPKMNFWTVESWDPLTLSPSILCKRCGDHGHIRNGRWERS